jgi:Flp pilus assembly protein TadG
MLSAMRVLRRQLATSRTQQGAVAVEFALVAPLLIALLLGTVTAGLSYSRSLGVTNAVREGARFGASSDTSASWPTDVIARVRQTQFDDPSSETSVCVEFFNSGVKDSTKSDCDAAGGPGVSASDLSAYPIPTGTTCVVRVVAARKFTINAVMVPLYSGTMVRGSVARYERDC